MSQTVSGGWRVARCESDKAILGFQIKMWKQSRLVNVSIFFLWDARRS